MSAKTNNEVARVTSGGVPSRGTQLLQRKCACGSSKSPVGDTCEKCQSQSLQRKLSIGASNDPLEAEADRVADQVLTNTARGDVSPAPPRIQRAAPGATQQTSAVPDSADRVLAASGSPLPQDLRADMEQRFAHDFSRVRVHTGTVATQSARDVQANAYTAGQHIVFSAGRFSPGTQGGRKLIAHELTHVVQQGHGEPRLQRDASDEPCGPLGFGSDWSFFGVIPGGPYANQGISIPYDKLAPVSDPMADFDPAESRRTFTDPARLEQVYYDATQPFNKFKDRYRAAWWLCTVVEDVAKHIGETNAGDLFKIGCLTLYNCGMNWQVVLKNFSSSTASGLRLQTLALKAFRDKATVLGANLQMISNALMLAGGVAAAKAGLNVPKPTVTAPTPAPPAKPPAVANTPTPTPPVPVPAPTPPAQVNGRIGFKLPGTTADAPRVEPQQSPPVSGFGRTNEPQPKTPASKVKTADPPVNTQMPPAQVRTPASTGGTGSVGQTQTQPTRASADKPKTGGSGSGAVPGKVEIRPAVKDPVRELDEWVKQGKVTGDVANLRARLRSKDAATRAEAQAELDKTRAAVEKGEIPEIEGKRAPRAEKVEDNRISTAEKEELENSAWLKGRLKDAADRRKFMDWLKKGHKEGDTGAEIVKPGQQTEGHSHLRPGSREAEAKVREWEQTAGKRGGSVP